MAYKFLQDKHDDDDIDDVGVDNVWTYLLELLKKIFFYDFLIKFYH